MKKELKDYLHLYLGCECRIGDSSKEYFIRMVNETGLSVCTGTNSKGIPIWYKSKSCKPILRPLSDMTEEEENKVAELCMGNDDFIITYRGMGYDDNGIEIHESVKCLKVETFCELPSINNWLPTALIQIDFEDDFCPIIFGRFEDAGNILKDDMLDYPFELTRYLLSKHFDVFGLKEAGLATFCWSGDLLVR